MLRFKQVRLIIKFEDKNTIPGPQFTHLLVDVGGKVNSNYYYPNIQPIYSKLENLFDKDYYNYYIFYF